MEPSKSTLRPARSDSSASGRQQRPRPPKLESQRRRLNDVNRRRAMLEAEEGAARGEVLAHIDQAFGLVFDEIDELRARLDYLERGRK